MLALARSVIAYATKLIAADWEIWINRVRISQRSKPLGDFVEILWMITIRLELLQRALVWDELPTCMGSRRYYSL